MHDRRKVSIAYCSHCRLLLCITIKKKQCTKIRSEVIRSRSGSNSGRGLCSSSCADSVPSQNQLFVKNQFIGDYRSVVGSVLREVY